MRPSASKSSEDGASVRSRLPWPATIFIVCTFIPCLWIWIWISGRAGGIRVPDIAIILFGGWAVLSLTMLYGMSAGMQSGGIIFVETVGAYLLGRCMVRGPDHFYALVRLIFWILAALSPFVIIEAVTNHNVSMAFFSKFALTHVVSLPDARWGLRRVQSVFEHPILFGISTSAALALVHMVLGERQSFVRRWRASSLVFVTASLSLSAGALVALVIQMFVIFWNWIFRNNANRWKLLWLFVLAMYVFISMISNQSVPGFLLTHFSFDASSAYYRILIWHFGSRSALNHPVFGTGFDSWDRPDWMPPSIDMFWLYNAIVFGIPAAILMLTAFASTVFPIGLRKTLPSQFIHIRVAYLAVMAGYFISGWTVHFWNATYVLFLFLLGSGAWLIDVKGDSEAQPSQGRGARAPIRPKPQPRRARKRPVPRERIRRP
jgi:hypothetical protein